MHTPNHSLHTAIIIITILIALSPILIAQTQALQLTASQDYKQFVHTTNKGNATALDKPIYPVMINNTQIQIGQNSTITCPLQANHQYHIYCYGAWTNTQTEAKTDYDIYVYDPSGSLVSTHTQAAGIIENVNSQDAESFFVPAKSGNYTFVVNNDARESLGTQQATFTIVENINCNQWYTAPIQGKNSNGTANLKTAWTYEFASSASRLEVYLTVPGTLDMYEARLFLMNDGSGPTSNGYPLAVESGLYGNITSGGVGGYNFETNESRGVAYDSCEHLGDDMFLTYTANGTGTKLYYLALNGEVGQGDVQLMVKTDFGEIALAPTKTISRVYPAQATDITYKTGGYKLEEANLTYSIDNWATSEFIPMAISDKTCSATVPGQNAGITVQYRVNAVDILRNTLSTTGSYIVKTQPKLNITLVKNTVFIGQNITVKGTLTPSDGNSVVDVQFMSANDTVVITCEVPSNGTFSCSFGPQSAGDWSVLATSKETDTSGSCSSSQFMIEVDEPPIYVKYSLYIVIGMVAACGAGGAVYYLKFRGK